MVVGSFAAPCGGVIVLCHGDDHSGSFGGGHHDGDRVDGGGLGGKKKLKKKLKLPSGPGSARVAKIQGVTVPGFGGQQLSSWWAWLSFFGPSVW